MFSSEHTARVGSAKQIVGVVVGGRKCVYMERVGEMWVQTQVNSSPQPVIMPALVLIFLE